MADNIKYYIRRKGKPEKEVTEQEFLEAEREAGFDPPKAGIYQKQTGGFTNGTITGRIVRL